MSNEEFEQYDAVRLRALMEAQSETTREKYRVLEHMADIDTAIENLEEEKAQFQEFLDGKRLTMPKKRYEAPEEYPNG